VPPPGLLRLHATTHVTPTGPWGAGPPSTTAGATTHASTASQFLSAALSARRTPGSAVSPVRAALTPAPPQPSRPLVWSAV